VLKKKERRHFPESYMFLKIKADEVVNYSLEKRERVGNHLHTI
jgi:hypothetical protein